MKAVAVRGTGSVEVAQPARFMEAVDKTWGKIDKSKYIQFLRKIGTMGAMYAKDSACSMPYKNFQANTIPPEAMKNWDPQFFLDRYMVRRMASMACPVHCSRLYKVTDGPYAGLVTEGFELNTFGDFAAKCAIDYPPAIIMAHALCNQLGIGLDEAAGAISWALECYQRGIITDKDTDGQKLQWGDHELIMDLIRKIAPREGFGNILAEGCKRASEMLGRGSSYYAVHMKGQDLYEEVRAPIGWGLGTCVATRGGGHTTSATACELLMEMEPEMAEVGKQIIGIRTFEPQSYEDKPELVVYTERVLELLHALGLCMFVGTWQDLNLIGIPELAEFYSAATGWETTEDEIVIMADRIFNLEKAFNV
ncbi:aldehyde ferredoxin oxidoreductase C-terminal domain-containing protein, partial [Chloroflexota bacterium]